MWSWCLEQTGTALCQHSSDSRYPSPLYFSHRRRTQSSGQDGRPQEEPHAEDLQKITVQVEPVCGVGVVVPKEQGAGVEVPPSGASAAATVEVDAASQASEPASQASDEEDAPSTDIYF